MTAPTLVRRPTGPCGAPQLDPAQRLVVEHPGGPMLVLAGPGTGKTTTLVESVVHRVEQRGQAPEQVLLLTFSRKAAQELRERVTARLGLTTRGPVAMTFHSYAYALLRRELTAGGGPGLRLLSGPEQDVEVARLLAGELADGALRWPEHLHPAVGLRGFRQELRDLVLRAQERGLSGVDLTALGRAAGRAEWVAAGGFLSDYEGRFDLDPGSQVLDYAQLVRAAADLLEGDDDLRRRERDERRVVFVDEYQDTDPAQVRLLQALAGDGRDLVAVGDPDQSIYGFRGAEVQGILSFPDAFPRADGAPAPQVQLRTCRRCGPDLLAASRAVAHRLPAGRLGPRFRELVPDAAVVAGPGRVEVLLAATPTAEAALVADVLRRAHLVDGVPWSAMAVLLRSTPRLLAGLRRGLLAAGVPVVVPTDEVPLAEEPVVRALLDLLGAALRPERLDEAAVLALLGGPLVRADALALRRLRRELRAAELARGSSTSSQDLLVTAVRGPSTRPTGVGSGARPGRRPSPLDRLQGLLAAVRDSALRPGPQVTAEDVLWAAWTSGGLAERLERDSVAGGSRGAVADRALDAVISLFDAAARYVDRLPGAGVLGFLDDVAAQEVPADALAQRTPEGDAVRVMTAHASKGLEWRVVVVAGVQEGVWPDLRLRGSLLGTADLSDVAQGRGQPAMHDRRGELLAQERRLFYVAVTRAQERLVVTAVAGTEGEDRPSRFLSELGVELPAAAGPVGRPLTGSGLLAELRRVAAATSDPALREAACRRLARLATGERAPAVALADPDRWWGLAPLSSANPLAASGETVRVSPSKVESFDTCALRWLLQTAVGVSGSSGAPQVLGSLVHALCELASAPAAPDRQALADQLAAVLPGLDLGAPWAARQRRDEALAWLDKFGRWAATNPRELVGTEVELRVQLAPDVELTGRVDRLERDAAGRAVVVDLKTGSAQPKADQVARHPQLGAYQVAAELGGFAGQGLTSSGGASLLQLKNGKDAKEQRQPALADDPEPGWAHDLVQRVVTGLRGSAFVAQANDGCSRCPVLDSCPLWPQGQGVLR